MCKVDIFNNDMIELRLEIMILNLGISLRYHGYSPIDCQKTVELMNNLQ